MMKVVSRFRLAMLVVALLLAIPGYFWIVPAQEIIVPVPINSAVARVQLWANPLSGNRYEIVVASPQGQLRRVMWTDWGPAQRTSLYVTPEDWVVALGGPASATIIAVPQDSPPELVPGPEVELTHSETWRYIGAVDKENGRLRHFSPAEQPECFAMFGEGSSPYRKEHQVERSCGA